MKLIIDAGNTAVKVAVYQGDTMLGKEQVKHADFFSTLKKIISNYNNFNRVIISSVSHWNKKELTTFFETLGISVIILSEATEIPFINLYATPATLGVDRIALVASAVSQFEKKNCLVIDAGSCVTYDFVGEDKKYFGGTISLGLQMRYKSLHAYTANLPLLAPKSVTSFEGNCTENAMHAGAMLGLITEINGVIEYFSNKTDGLVVILTGGDAEFLSKRLKNGIFVRPNFLIEGLNHILDFNSNK